MLSMWNFRCVLGVSLWLTLLNVKEASLQGHIGTIPDESIEYTPTNDSSLFYLNNRDPANATGTISHLRYCYTLQTGALRSHQATVGIYRREGDQYILSHSFNITKNTTLNDEKFQCESLKIPRVEVQSGEFIGVCSRLFDKSIGRIILVARQNGDDDLLLRNDLDDRESFCLPEGNVPRIIYEDQLELVPSHLLLLYANISTNPLTSAPPIMTVSNNTDPESRLFEPLPNAATYAIIAAVAMFLVYCFVMGSVWTCCYLKRRKKRQARYSPYPRTQAYGTSDTDYVEYDEINRTRNAQRRVKPHVIGPANLSSSSSYGAKNRVFSSQSSEIEVLEEEGTKEFEKLDITAVVYSQLQDRETLSEHNSLLASQEDQLYAHLENCGSLTLKRSEIEIEEIAGNFVKAVWKRKDERIEIHLKRGEDKMESLQEAAILVQLKHPNVVTFYGILVDDLQVTIVEELLTGTLKSFLKRIRPAAAEPGTAISRVTPKMLLNFSQQVALGMKYISSKGFVHGKTMACSIMLSSCNVCKITDFSWSRDIANDKLHDLDIQIKWSAPEVTLNSHFSVASDVWNYGCLLYEIWTLGKDPFEGESSLNVLEIVKAGWRLNPPPGCPKVIYELMMESWNPEAKERPSFTQLVNDLTRVEALVLNVPQKLLDQHPHCAELGASLSIGKLMYRDIHMLYCNKDVDTVDELAITS